VAPADAPARPRGACSQSRAWADASVRRGMSEKSLDLIRRREIAAGAALELEDENRNTPLSGRASSATTRWWRRCSQGANFRKRNAWAGRRWCGLANAGHLTIVNRLVKAARTSKRPTIWLTRPLLRGATRAGGRDAAPARAGRQGRLPNRDGARI